MMDGMTSGGGKSGEKGLGLWDVTEIQLTGLPDDCETWKKEWKMPPRFGVSAAIDLWESSLKEISACQDSWGEYLETNSEDQSSKGHI